MIWILGAFSEWLKDSHRISLEFKSLDVLIIGCTAIGFMVALNLLM